MIGKRDGRYIGIKNRSGYFCLDISSIQYIETCDRKTLLHVGGTGILSSFRMYEYERRLWDAFFVRCHTSYIVNLSYAFLIDKHDMKLITGEVVPVSRSKRSMLLNRMDEFILSGGRGPEHGDRGEEDRGGCKGCGFQETKLNG